MAVINRSLSRNYAPTKERDPNKYHMYPIVAGGVMLMIGLMLFSSLSQMRIVPNYLQDAAFVVPALFFIPVAVMAYKGKIPKRHCSIVTTILLVLAIVAVPMSAITTIMQSYTTPVDDPAYYNKAMQVLGIQENEIIKSFPAEMPLEAQDATFYYGADVNDHSMRIELNFRIGQHMAEPMEETMKSKALWSGTLEELKASEYAAAAEQIPTAQPADAAYYILYTTTLEDGVTMDSMVLNAAAPDGTLYYLYKVWTVQ